MRVPLLSVQKFVFTRAPSAKPAEDPPANLHQEVSATAAIATPEAFPASIPGYFFVSTAPINTEDSQPPDPEIELGFQQATDQIVEHLQRCQEGGDSPELVVLIHGYNTRQESAETWYKSVFKYINRIDSDISANKNAVFIGYRWSSENMQFNQITDALAAMPIVPRVMLRVECIVGLVAAILLLLAERWMIESNLWLRILVDALLVGLLGISIFLGAIFVSLVLLRLSAYFRDSYRATHYGVPDLVELLRSLDYKLGSHPPGKGAADAAPLPLKNRVKLTLIGHSMGGFVVTNTVRILSDVFDVRSIEKHPTSEIGKSFCLERLILASPDIPVLTIAAGRANFLSSSLRRFAEAYLFSNQGDIVLRIASTAANYFSFPARTRSSGYRLGNLAVRSDAYGIINWDNLQAHYEQQPPGSVPLEPALQQLFVSNLEVRDPLATRVDPGVASRTGLPNSIAALSQERFRRDFDRLTIADLFTYFDCTDCCDTTERSDRPTGILSRARRKPFLGFWDYLQLTLDYGKAPDRGRIDVHGGYFEGQWTRQVIYRLAFLGFDGLLRSLDPTASTPRDALPTLDQSCRDRGIKLLLSPLRHLVHVQRTHIHKAKSTLMDKIEDT